MNRSPESPEAAERESTRAEAPVVSAVIVNYEGGDLLLSCIRSLLDQDTPLEVILVDNHSADGSTAAALTRFPRVRLATPTRNLGFAGGANFGAECGRGRILLFLNPDVELSRGCVAALVERLDRARVGVVGPVTEITGSETLEFGATIDRLGYPVGLSTPGRPLYVPGSALATHAELFRCLGGFDERFFMFVEDVDYCWRSLLAGWDVTVAPEAHALHRGGASAPGGYVRAGGFATTRFRVSLRERNTLAMLLKCERPASLAGIAVAYVLQSAATACAALLARRPRTAAAVLPGLLWNLREWRRTQERRRVARAGGNVPDLAIRTRMYPRLRKLELFRRHGFPVVDESRSVDPVIG